MSLSRRRTYPFRLVYQLVALLLVMSVGPLILFSRKMMDINQRALENSILNLHTQAASRLRESLEMFVGNVRASVVELARLQGMTDILDAQEQQSILLNFIGSHDYAVVVKIYGPTGSETASVSRDRSTESIFLGIADLAAGLKAANEGTYYFGQAFPGPESGTAYLPVVAPVRSNSGQNIGALAALIDLHDVQKMVAGTHVGRQGRAFLVDRLGRAIAHPDAAKVAARADLTRLEIVGSNVLAGRSGGTVPFVEADGREMLGAYDLVREMGWGVVVEEPKSDAYLSLDQMRRQTVIWIVIVSSLALLVAIVLSAGISRPIRTFAQRALAVARGDFRGSMEIKSRNEIGQLAETFNFMVRELAAYDHNMRDLFLSTIKSLAAAVDAKDPYTRGHSDRVTQYCVAIGREMGIGGRDLENIQIAGLLHDVGKIGIDDAILRKPGRLSEEEYAIIKMHPVFGANIMGPIKQLREVIPGMKYHHEMYNGSGYPDGLRRDEIPLMSRIIAVADSFDAMTSDRPYQKATDDTHVLRQLARLAGVRYDPAVVRAFIASYAKLGRGTLTDNDVNAIMATPQQEVA